MEIKKFNELELSKEIIKAVEEMGFEAMTPIQYQAIPQLMEGHDVIGQAQTGTGKTAAFGIPVIEKIDASLNKVQALILAPTRELAVQVSAEISKLSKYKKGIKPLPIYGGQSIDRQIMALKKGVNIVVGTPGRIQDHINRRTLKLDSVKMVVLDEADEMLDMGFIEDIENILVNVPTERQSIFFSATMSKEILKLANKYLDEPVTVKVVHDKLAVPTIEQFYFDIQERSKLELLSRLIDMYDYNLMMVFAKTKKGVDELVEGLQQRGYYAEGIHGDMKQSQREAVLKKFRSGSVEILVATDVAARGLDINDVEAVVNYDMPQDEEYYIHRIGRTGRAGRSGVAYTFVTNRDFRKLKDIERYSKTTIQRMKLPTISDVEGRRDELFMNKVKNIVEEGGLEKYAPLAERLFHEISPIDVAGALIKMLLPKDDKQAQEEDFANVKPREDRQRRETRGKTNEDTVRLFVNIGKSNNISPKDILAALTQDAGLPGSVVGVIDIYDKFTFVEVGRSHAKEVLKGIKNIKIKGKKVNIEKANQKK